MLKSFCRRQWRLNDKIVIKSAKTVGKRRNARYSVLALYAFLTKILLLRNSLSDFEIISQKCSLSDLSQKLSGKFLSVSENGISEWGPLALYRH